MISYLLLTLALTYPLLLQFAHAIPGDGFDGWQNYWNLWWIKIALLGEHTQPFFTNLLYYPTGVSLLFHTLNPFNGLLTLPVQIAWGLLPAYNTVVLFSFAVGGFGTYLLARQVLGSQRSHLPAFAAGVIFTFSPFHFAHLLGHMQVISLEWIPFYALYLIRLVDPKSQVTKSAKIFIIRATYALKPKSKRVASEVLLAAFFLILVGLCDWYYVLYCAILTGVVLVWAGWRAVGKGGRVGEQGDRAGEQGDEGAREQGGRGAEGLGAFRRSARSPDRSQPGKIASWTCVIAGSLAVWLIFGLVLSPLLVPMIREARQFRFMVPDPTQSRTLSADLLAFVTPQEFHPLWGAWARERAAVFASTVSEHQVFAGFTALALAALGLWAGWRKDRKKQGMGPWPLALLTFFVLALGPVLHIAGRTELLPGGREIPLPYGWLVRVIPFMEISRSVSRFDVMVMLAIAILAAWGIQWLLLFFVRHGLVQHGLVRQGFLTVATAAAVIVIGLILFEFLPVPYPLSPPDTPAWYATLASEPGAGAVLNLPMSWDRPGYLLYQTVHHKPLTVAYISREDPRTLTERAPVLQHFRHLGPDILDFDLAAQGQQVLHDLDVRWVVLDRYKMPGGRERAYTEATARQIFGQQPPVYEDQRLTVYAVASAMATAPYLILGEGWGPFDAQHHSRSFVGSGSLTIRSPADGQALLRVRVAPDSAPLDLPMADGMYVTTLNLHPGNNEFALHARRPDQRVVVSELAIVSE